DYTMNGFHGLSRAPEGKIYLDPYALNQTEYYISYYRNDYTEPGRDISIECEVTPEDQAIYTESQDILDEPFSPNIQARQAASEIELRTYRFAVACTGQYAQFHGGTKPLALAALVEAVNRINSIFEYEIAVRFLLIDN